MIDNVKVYDMKESIVASGYPFQTELKKHIEKKDVDRAIKLGNAPCGSGHDNALKGILVSFDLTFTNKAWIELQRYNFITFVSSQSTMHRIARFDLNEQYNDYVDDRIIAIMNELKHKYVISKDKEDYLKLLYSNPAGFKLTARLTTNYCQLKTVYKQRYNHKLPEWREFCKWVLTLPKFKELTGVINE